MDLIERVALKARIGAECIWTEAFAEWAMQLDKDVGDQAAIKEIADGFEAAARAAIAEVLDAMMEPSEGMKTAFIGKALKVAISGEYPWPDYARDQWRVMLAQFRKEVEEG